MRTAWKSESDYAVAKVLGISRSAVSGYRSRTPTLDESTALSIAAVLGERPEAVLLDQYAERTADPKARTALSAMARSLSFL